MIIVLDGVGIGELPDAEKFGDSGSNTLKNIAVRLGGLKLPNLERLGLGNIEDIPGISKLSAPLASFGKMNEVSSGKDSTTGHWELGGLRIDFEFPYYPHGFPDEIINNFLRHAGVEGVLCNKPASGTAVIEQFGKEHLLTGFPIVYTSADSVFQIAAHEEIIPIERLYNICKITREKILTGKDAVGRVIARPFIGEFGNFKRTTNRKDFSLDPPSDTILNVLQKSGIKTIGIGKVNDLFNYSGLDISQNTKSNSEGINFIIENLRSKINSFIFSNLVDFDVYFGHRNDAEGFAKALQEFDNRLGEIIEAMDKEDILIITADHGNDPTTPSTDHSREYVPLLYFNKKHKGNYLGIRKTFADVAQTAAHFYGVNNSLHGESFLIE